jgi:putative mycofactocin binding protein MftB
VSTDPAGTRPSSAFDLDSAWRLHPQAEVRPELFGALLYHFGTRRLSFLKSRTLLEVIRALDLELSARSACVAAGVRDEELPLFARALDGLAASDMICPRGDGRAPA